MSEEAVIDSAELRYRKCTFWTHWTAFASNCNETSTRKDVTIPPYVLQSFRAAVTEDTSDMPMHGLGSLMQHIATGEDQGGITFSPDAAIHLQSTSEKTQLEKTVHMDFLCL